MLFLTPPLRSHLACNLTALLRYSSNMTQIIASALGGDAIPDSMLRFCTVRKNVLLFKLCSVSASVSRSRNSRID
jgi:hypothetical protein